VTLDNPPAASELLSAAIVAGALKPAFLLVFTGLGIYLARRSSAAVRCNIWGVSILLLLLLPLFSRMLPTWRFMPAKTELDASHQTGPQQSAASPAVTSDDSSHPTA
jgi:hypothetical protein